MYIGSTGPCNGKNGARLQMLQLERDNLLKLQQLVLSLQDNHSPATNNTNNSNQMVKKGGKHKEGAPNLPGECIREGLARWFA
jgi:hypothetical protein